MENILYGITASVLILIGLSWNRESWLNFFLKITTLTVGIANLIMLFKNLGYIIKVG